VILRFALLVAALAATAATAVGPAPAAAPTGVWPQAGGLLRDRVVARKAPDPRSAPVRTLRQFRSDFRPQVVLATEQVVGADGKLWDKLLMPMRPNGTVGWVPASSVSLTPRQTHIVVRRSLRRIDVFRGAKVVFRAAVAVGSRGRETPLGSFYVTARFVPDTSFLGTFALETSAYSKLTDWPGGGVVGIHGTSMPWLLGQAVSHGCVRVSNATANRLRALAPLGTPVTIVR
jgi:lipoprotein-anchoring transpeptidase ErfK/SrfK